MTAEEQLQEAQIYDVCPRCGSDSSQWEPCGYEFECEAVVADWHCEECETSFSQTYNLAGCVIKEN